MAALIPGSMPSRSVSNAAAFDSSPRTLARHFAAQTGMAPLRWLTAARIREARRLLEATDLPVEVIAARCGLGTAANLRLHLARDAGTTPTSYRAAYQGHPPDAREAGS